MTHAHAMLIVTAWILLIVLAVPVLTVFAQPDYTDNP